MFAAPSAAGDIRSPIAPERRDVTPGAEPGKAVVDSIEVMAR
jgi:hypothetical protein